MGIIYWLKEKFYKLSDFISSVVISCTSGFKDGMEGKPREYTYVRALNNQNKEFKTLKKQGIVNNWSEYKALKEKQNKDN